MKFSDWFQKPNFSVPIHYLWPILFGLVFLITIVPGGTLEIISFGTFRYSHLLNIFETFCMRKMS